MNCPDCDEWEIKFWCAKCRKYVSPVDHQECPHCDTVVIVIRELKV